MDTTKLTNGERLCLECGLCCQGVFHPYADLNDETDKKRADYFHATTQQHDSLGYGVFLLPCPAFTGLCNVYPERPSVCQTHQCKLLTSVSSDEMDLVKALGVVDNIKDIINRILPMMHAYSNEYYYNKPELLMDKILKIHSSDKERTLLKKKNIQLFSNYGLFLMYRKKYFYDSVRKSKQT